jgi:hypothetical protein
VTRSEGEVNEVEEMRTVLNALYFAQHCNSIFKTFHS